MLNREELARKAQETFEERWSRGDPWDVEGSELDQASYAFQIGLLGDRRYERALEIGCGSGVFTQRLLEVAHRVLAIDIAPSAVERARAALPDERVEFRVANLMDFGVSADGPWDLIVMSETIYCLGWLYPLFDLGMLVSDLHAATRPGGRFLMANTYGEEKDYLLRRWLIDTYRDVFLNVGYRREAEEVFRGSKNGVDFEILVTLFAKDGG